MTVFTTVITPSDIHDFRFKNPNKISSNIQYQIPPTNYLTIFQIQTYLADLANVPDDSYFNSVLSFSVSNNSFRSYHNSKLLKQHVDILWENIKLNKIDLNFSQFKMNDEVLQRILCVINHIQKHSNYGVFLSLTIPINKDFKIDDEYILLISKFHNDFVNFNMINIFILKNFKRKHLSWFEITKLIYKNVVSQLKQYDSKNELFIGSIEKYIGFVFDSDIIFNDEIKQNHLMQSLNLQKNLTESEVLDIWGWCNRLKIGQLQLHSYLSNSKKIFKLIQKHSHMFGNKQSLLSPRDMLFQLADEVGLGSITAPPIPLSSSFLLLSPPPLSTSTSSSSSSSSSLSTPCNKNNTFSIKELPSYETVILDKIMEYEREMNELVKLPSYRTMI